MKKKRKKIWEKTQLTERKSNYRLVRRRSSRLSRRPTKKRLRKQRRLVVKLAMLERQLSLQESQALAPRARKAKKEGTQPLPKRFACSRKKRQNFKLKKINCARRKKTKLLLKRLPRKLNCLLIKKRLIK